MPRRRDNHLLSSALFIGQDEPSTVGFSPYIYPTMNARLLPGLHLGFINPDLDPRAENVKGLHHGLTCSLHRATASAGLLCRKGYMCEPLQAGPPSSSKGGAVISNPRPRAQEGP